MPNNPSPWGALAEGLAGGISGGAQNYVTMALHGIDREQKNDMTAAEIALKLMSDADAPESVRLQSYDTIRKIWGKWNLGNGEKLPDLPEGAFSNKELTNDIKSVYNLFTNEKDYSNPMDRLNLATQKILEIKTKHGKKAAEAVKTLEERLAGETTMSGIGLMQESRQPITPYAGKSEFSPQVSAISERLQSEVAAEKERQGMGLLAQTEEGRKGLLKATLEPTGLEPKTEFALFYKAYKAKGLNDSEIDAIWAARELEAKKAGATRVSQSVHTRQETEEAKVVGKGFGETYMKIQDAGIAADKTINQYGRMKELLTSARTGKIRPTTMTIAAYAKDLGFNIDPGLPAAQALQALTNQLALELRNPSGGAGMPGALSDKDVQFLKESVVGLSQTPAGNELMIDYAMKLAQRNKEVARLARDYRKKHRTIDEGFYDELEKFSEANPLFGGKKRVGRFTVEEE